MAEKKIPRPSLEILDLPPNTTPDQARQAYRDLINVWHPDRYAHNPRLQQKAEQKIKAINVAYGEVADWLKNRSEPAGPQSSPAANEQPQQPNQKSKSSAEPDTSRSAGPDQQVERASRWQRTNSLLADLNKKRIRQMARNEALRQARVKNANQATTPQSVKKTADPKPKTASPHGKPKTLDRQKSWAQTDARLRMLQAARMKTAAQAGFDQTTRKASNRRKLSLQGWFIRSLVYCAVLATGLVAGFLLPAFPFKIPATIGASALCLGLGHGLMTHTPLKRFFTQPGQAGTKKA